MRIEQLEAVPVRVPYTHAEVSSLVARGGVTDVIVKAVADNGLIGWGECTRAADAAGIASAIEAMRPIVLGRDPFDGEAIAHDVFVGGAWQFQAMTGNFAFAGIDMALWDLCGKVCGQPLYRLFGGAVREEVDYFYYLHWGTAEELEAQCQDGVERGYTVFYLKVGVDVQAEEAMLAAVVGVVLQRAGSHPRGPLYRDSDRSSRLRCGGCRAGRPGRRDWHSARY
jgi:glucarate dehydratase